MKVLPGSSTPSFRVLNELRTINLLRWPSLFLEWRTEDLEGEVKEIMKPWMGRGDLKVNAISENQLVSVGQFC